MFRIESVVLAFFVVIRSVKALEITRFDRRAAINRCGCAAAAICFFCPSAEAKGAKASILDRLSADNIREPPVKQRSELDALFSAGDKGGGLYDDLFFPAWVEGTWACESKLTAFYYPLGKRFLSGPSGLQSDVADKTIAEEKALIGKSIGPYPVRYIKVRRGGQSFIVEDRAANIRSRAEAYAGRPVVGSVTYVELGGANKISYGDAPLPTTLTRFKGGAVQKIFSNNRDAEFIRGIDSNEAMENTDTGVYGGSPDSWVGFELTRSLLAVPGTDRPPIATDTETITELVKPSVESPSVVMGRVRVAEYLTPNDALYFDARQRAVSISDYTIRMEKSS